MTPIKLAPDPLSSADVEYAKMMYEENAEHARLHEELRSIDGVRYGGSLVRPDGKLDEDSLRTAVQRALESIHLLPDTRCNWNDARSEVDRER